MTVASVVVAPRPRAGGGAASVRAGSPRLRRRGGFVAPPSWRAVVGAALEAGLDETVVVVGDEASAAELPDGATVLLDESERPTSATSARAALDWCARQGHAAVVLAVVTSEGASERQPPSLLTDATAWRRLAGADGPVVVLGSSGPPAGPVRLDATVWPLLPLDGDLGALWRQRPELVVSLAFEPPPQEDGVAGGAPPPVPQEAGVAGGAPPPAERPGEDDLAAVRELLGRPPAGAFRVVARDPSGGPVVIENAPLLEDGTPMPTRYWLVGRRERDAVSRLESAGGVRRAEEEVPAGEVAAGHARYAAERDAALPSGHRGPAPSGGVGGTRQGVKCLHAHLAAYLAGNGDPVGRWTARRLSGELDGPVAAVDCGTNSTRLLIAGPDGRTLERLMRITRLGEGVDASGALAEAAIERTLQVLAEFRDEMDRLGVVSLRATATSAAREASNARLLMEPASELLGIALEVLSGDEEGRLSSCGATAELDPTEGPYLVVDLGGGSTELIAGAAAAMSPDQGAVAAPPGAGGRAADPGARAPSPDLTVVSLAAGCVRMTERYLSHDPPTSREVADAGEAATLLVAQALAAHPELGGARRMVGVAGTVTTLAALDLGLDRYDPSRTHHLVLGSAAVSRLRDELAGMTRAERRRRPAMEPARADVIVGGAAVLAAVMATLGYDELLVSETDSLDGIVAGLLARRHSR